MIAALLLAAATRCAACHEADGWSKVVFDHLKRTGFALEGRHAETTCASCHAGLDFKAKLSTRCSACHEDVHLAEFGVRCEGCHDPRSWQSRFDADAHRNTSFPLLGRHAFIPCEECHLDMRDRSFIRATVQCTTCHTADFQRTASTGIDHVANNFSKTCTDCHGAYAFSPAHFPAHDTCFELSGGPHAGIRCLDCHTTLRSTAATGTCNTNTAVCTNCHTHSQPRTDPEHTGVPGYQYQYRKCYECHMFTRASSLAPRRIRR
jgi:hypothetical protein